MYRLPPRYWSSIQHCEDGRWRDPQPQIPPLGSSQTDHGNVSFLSASPSSPGWRQSPANGPSSPQEPGYLYRTQTGHPSLPSVQPLLSVPWPLHPLIAGRSLPPPFVLAGPLQQATWGTVSSGRTRVFSYLGFILHNWDLICAPLDPVLPLLY